MFDFYNNLKNSEIKIAYRFIFQSNNQTLKDYEIDKYMQNIYDIALSIKSVGIPGID